MIYVIIIWKKSEDFWSFVYNTSPNFRLSAVAASAKEAEIQCIIFVFVYSSRQYYRQFVLKINVFVCLHVVPNVKSLEVMLTLTVKFCGLHIFLFLSPINMKCIIQFRIYFRFL